MTKSRLCFIYPLHLFVQVHEYRYENPLNGNAFV